MRNPTLPTIQNSGRPFRHVVAGFAIIRLGLMGRSDRATNAVELLCSQVLLGPCKSGPSTPSRVENGTGESREPATMRAHYGVDFSPCHVSDGERVHLQLNATWPGDLGVFLTLITTMGSQGDGEFRFPAPIKTVAVIGAGISGVVSAAHLLRQGLDVTVFERSSVPGGVWHFDPRVPTEPPYPNERPPTSTPENTTLSPSSSGPHHKTEFSHCTFEEVSLTHAPPGPCYAGLRNNVSTPVMRTTLMDWPEGTPDYITHEQVEKYIHDLAVRTSVQDRVQYHTCVDSVGKNSDAASGWTIHTQTLRRVTGDEAAGDYEIVDREWVFDAVVAASGRYHEPRIPDMPGLKEWKQRFPDNVFHSKRYRSPELFRGKTVFVVGGGVSALDVVKEIVGLAQETYQSSRRGKYDLPGSMFADGVNRVGPVDKFVPGEEGAGTGGSVVLSDGQVVPQIDMVVLCTGYITTYPYLGHLQNPAVSREEADDKVIITSDGCTTHNLHKDLFYIPDPSLVFVGVPYHASAFSLFDFQANVLARVFAGKARLPSLQAMRSEYDERKAGISAGGHTFHSLMKKDVEYMQGLQDWVNQSAATLGHEPMDGIDDGWVKSYFSFLEELKGRRWDEPDQDQEVTFVGEELREDHVRLVGVESG